MQGLALQCPIKMRFPSLWIDTTETAPDNAESVLSMYRLRFNSKKKITGKPENIYLEILFSWGKTITFLVLGYHKK